jgi:hypothetical protein
MVSWFNYAYGGILNEREKEVLSEKMVLMVMVDYSSTSGNCPIVDGT